LQPVISVTGHYAGIVRTRDNSDLGTNYSSQPVFFRTGQAGIVRTLDDADLGTNNSCSLLSLGRDKQGLYGPVATLTWAQIILAACYLWDGMQNVSTHNIQIVSHSLRVHAFFCSALFIVVFFFS
jgi:hypothetical protein